MSKCLEPDNLYAHVAFARLAQAINCASDLPADALGMVIHRDSQFVATLGASSLEDILSVSSLHTRTETMHAQASMNFRLISPLRHYTFLSYQKFRLL